MMDFVKIVTQIASMVAETEAATTDAVAVEVVLAEVDAATVMTATLVAFLSTQCHDNLTNVFCTDSATTVTT